MQINKQINKLKESLLTQEKEPKGPVCANGTRAKLHGIDQNPISTKVMIRERSLNSATKF